MKKYFQLYRPFLVFLVKFFSAYGLLTLVYRWYLSRFDNVLAFEVDGFSKTVAEQVRAVLHFFGFQAQLQLHESQPSIKLIIEGHYVSRIVEGCNALSVMILFVAFVVAFSGKWFRTLLFLVGGCALIHGMNVFRIALLSVALLHYPQQEPLLHGVVFPLMIYGFVFALWVIWVHYFSTYAAKK